MMGDNTRGFGRRGAMFLGPRFWTGFAITGFFLVMVGSLVRREAAGRQGVRKLGISPDMLTVTWADYDQYMYVERDGQRVGGYSLRVTRGPEPTNPKHIAYDLISRMSMKMKVAGREVAVTTDAVVHMNDAFMMQTFQGVIRAMGTEVAAEAFTEGLDMYYRFKLPPMVLEEKERAEGAIISKTRLTEPVIMADAVRPLVTRPDKLKVGNTWTVSSSNPLSAQFNTNVKVTVEAREEITLGGEKFNAFRVTEDAGQVRVVSWYDAEGKVLKSDMGNRLTMTRVPDSEVVGFVEKFPIMPNMRDIPKEELKSKAVAQSESLLDRLNRTLQTSNPPM